jgi:hypothetical protein
MKETEILTPILCFTLADGRNPQSENILASLLLMFRDEEKGLAPECIAFSDADAIHQHFLKRNISPACAVAIFDDLHIGSKCFSPVHREGKKNLSHIPSWSPAHWGVMVNPKIPEIRTCSAASQIRADFYVNFSRHIAEGKLPWGNPPSPRRNTKRHKETREDRRMRRQRERDSLLLVFA